MIGRSDISERLDCRLVKIQLARRDTCERHKATPAETFAQLRPRPPRWLLASPTPLSWSDSFIVSPACHFPGLRCAFVPSHLERSSVGIDRFCRPNKQRNCTLSFSLLLWNPSYWVHKMTQGCGKSCRICWKSICASQENREKNNVISCINDLLNICAHIF